MSSTTNRLRKEARAVFAPWCMVSLGSALALLLRSPSLAPSGTWFLHFLGSLGVFAVFLGFPLMATLSFGSEFQHGTFSMLLSQPVSRIRIWAEKMGVTAVAVLIAAAIQVYVWRAVLLDTFPHLLRDALPLCSALALATLAALISSSVYWTLVARSTMGGVALTIVVPAIVLDGAILAERILGPMSWLAETRSVLFVATLAALGYGSLMFWLSRHKLLQFQASGSIAGSDLLTTGPAWIPQTLTGWLRCRPSGATWNLIRKEFHLQQPNWLIAPVVALSWISIAVCSFVLPSPRTLPQGLKGPLEMSWRMEHLLQSPSVQVVAIIAFILVASGTTLMAILAGCLSLGEERTWGTHSWHMTLPLSARRQWLVKLAMAVLTSAFCTTLVPLLATGFISLIFGSHPWFSGEILSSLVGATLFTLASFWCACAVRGTSRAALWVAPVMGAVFGGGWLGYWGGQALGPACRTVRGFVIVTFHLRPYTLANIAPWFWVLPTVVFAVLQTYQMFRVQAQESSWHFLPRLLWLTLVAFLCSLAANAVGYSSF